MLLTLYVPFNIMEEKLCLNVKDILVLALSFFQISFNVN